MNVHDPRAHTVAMGLLFASAFAAGFALTNENRRITDASVGYQVTAADLSSVPFGQNEWIVFAASGSGNAPLAFRDAIDKAGGRADIEGDMLPHFGIWISPDTPEGHSVADAISKIIGEPVKVGNASGGAFEIGVGRPEAVK